MKLGLNYEQPNIMHIDLNSCFAMVEQQARPSLRGKPLGVTNRLTKNACVIAASYEAKAKGIKVGMPFSEAKLLEPQLLMLETDPPKYHYVYEKLVAIMKSYSPKIKMKSIDEGIIDFHGTREHINGRPLTAIGYEIKQRLRDEVGCWMKCNIGIAPNRFLAKLAAGLHKPDGLDVITYQNLRQVLGGLELTDLPGIARHFEARLNASGIYTPLQFLDAEPDLLRRRVFKSVIGEDWHQRLRGHEVDDVVTRLGMVGRQYVLDVRSTDDTILLPRLQYLCQTTAMKLRFNGVDARGVLVWAMLQTGEYWQQRKMFKSTFYTDEDVWRRAVLLFNQRPKDMIVTTIGITCYQLTPSTRNQNSLFEEVNRAEWLTETIDEVNGRFGNFTVTYAAALPAKGVVKQKLPFGSTKYFELLCRRA
jgi:DNA polymerase-4